MIDDPDVVAHAPAPPCAGAPVAHAQTPIGDPDDDDWGEGDDDDEDDDEDDEDDEDPMQVKRTN